MQITTTDGKTKYQAQVWHKGVYYASKTFFSISLAELSGGLSSVKMTS